jgi:hypothetical protein
MAKPEPGSGSGESEEIGKLKNYTFIVMAKPGSGSGESERNWKIRKWENYTLSGITKPGSGSGILLPIQFLR